MAFVTDAVKFVQHRRNFYVTALPVGELEICSIDRWDPQKVGAWKGYQRDLVERKVKNIAEYLERPDAVMPMAGLLNVREKGRLKFSNASRTYPAGGKLTIPDYTRLWVVDMQHRLEGLRRAKHFRYAVPVVIAEGLSEIDEAGQFYVINTTSKRMDVALTRRLLIQHDRIRDLSDVPEWELKALKIAMDLNSTAFDENPWRGRIREPNTERSRLHVATEKSFIPSLRWLLAAPETKRKSPRQIAEFLALFWNSIQETIPEAFDEPRRFLIQKTPGYMSLHRIAPIVYRRVHQLPPVRAERQVKRIMSKLSARGAGFWSNRNSKGAKRFGTGQGGYGNLAIYLTELLGLDAP